MVAAKLCFTDSAEVLPPLMQRLISMREEAKAHKGTATTAAGRHFWHTAQLALKAIANSFYGNLGSPAFRFRSRRVAAAIA